MKIVLRILTVLIAVTLVTLALVNEALKPADLPDGCQRNLPSGNHMVTCTDVDLQELIDTGAASEIVQLSAASSSVATDMSAFSNLQVLTLKNLPNNTVLNPLDSLPALLQLNLPDFHGHIDLRAPSLALGALEPSQASFDSNTAISKLTLASPMDLPVDMAKDIKFLIITEPLSETLDLTEFSSLELFSFKLTKHGGVVLPSHLENNTSIKERQRKSLTHLSLLQ